MPVSRLLTEGLANQVAGIYGTVELRLLRLIAQQLQAGADSPTWAENKLAELQLLRKRAESMAAGATLEGIDALTTAVQAAYLRGVASGQGDLDELGVDFDGDVPQAERAVASLVSAQSSTFKSIGLQIVRSVDDAYREVIARASVGTLTGASTRLQDAQTALDDLARKGLRGPVDSSGRRWNVRTYVEMATRTTSAQAAVSGHLDRLEQAGIPLVIVSDSPRECEICRPWEGKVLSRGPVDAMLPNALTGQLERVTVDGTVNEATRDGLFHPNCTHNLSAYIPGATKRGATANPEGFEERARLRALERTVREWKRREAVAVTPEAARKARGKVREWQAAIRDHVEATGLNRKRNRESLTAAI